MVTIINRQGHFAQKVRSRLVHIFNFSKSWQNNLALKYFFYNFWTKFENFGHCVPRAGLLRQKTSKGESSTGRETHFCKNRPAFFWTRSDTVQYFWLRAYANAVLVIALIVTRSNHQDLVKLIGVLFRIFIMLKHSFQS